MSEFIAIANPTHALIAIRGSERGEPSTTTSELILARSPTTATAVIRVSFDPQHLKYTRGVGANRPRRKLRVNVPRELKLNLFAFPQMTIKIQT